MRKGEWIKASLEKVEKLKPIEISISPDLLNLEKVKELKNKYKTAKEYAIKTDQN